MHVAWDVPLWYIMTVLCRGYMLVIIIENVLMF